MQPAISQVPSIWGGQMEEGEEDGEGGWVG